MGLLSRLTRRHTAGALSPQVRSVVDLAGRERVLATAHDDRTHDLLVATSRRVVQVHELDGADPVLRLSRTWHEIDAGSWEPQTATISVTWVDGGRASQWSLIGGGQAFSEAFYERVDSSVLLDAPLDVPVGDGDRRVGRVALRRDLGTGDIVSQIVWARGVRREPALQEYAEAVLADLAEQIGLDEGPRPSDAPRAATARPNSSEHPDD